MDSKLRQAEIVRKTRETAIELSFNIDGTGKSDIQTGIGFLDHMLELFAKHGFFDLTIHEKGDIHVDYHHSAEDIGICLGKAFAQAIGDCRGICRYGNILLPMDEALIMTVVDISGRNFLAYGLDIPMQKVGDFDTELVEEFFLGLVRNANVTLHVRQLDGTNSHHVIEGMFKSFGMALRAAVSIDADFADEIPSTKGVL